MILVMVTMMIKMDAPEDGFWTTGKEKEMLEHICNTRGSTDAQGYIRLAQEKSTVSKDLGPQIGIACAFK